MFLKKVLNQPNVVGTVMIALLFGAGFVYAFAFDGFNVHTVTDGEVEVWLAQVGDGYCNHTCGKTNCPGDAGGKCKKCQSKTQFRCKDNCKGGVGCHKTCIKAGDRWCNGATQCSGCGAG